MATMVARGGRPAANTRFGLAHIKFTTREIAEPNEEEFKRVFPRVAKLLTADEKDQLSNWRLVRTHPWRLYSPLRGATDHVNLPLGGRIISLPPMMAWIVGYFCRQCGPRFSTEIDASPKYRAESSPLAVNWEVVARSHGVGPCNLSRLA